MIGKHIHSARVATTSLPTLQLLLIAGTIATHIMTAPSASAAESKPNRPADSPVTITAGPDWVPLDVNLDIEPGSALDFSDVVPHHAGLRRDRQ